ncbi:peptidoglycan -binding protein [Denitromonas ohlonensis]|uniref:Peptidoglycan-binding protein n=2 Tax=Denitromonas TaxID=139331 RepID=A0A557SNT9_9RHOO|nr:peptidoglycan -binding protein [Denitromonas ohlonensis]TVO67027.1 peptidoglycan -binding protein [Denitromonas ohlonensis]TVO79087.1 peptidoglycan -binding protein [Denitromonas ohlonensis]TVT50767.1 MAG: peptidoglycan -binding protein [Denitromonas halophila]TVT74739.1 MAG: peptidoglycan -binding protein [Denitromonas halophila]
MASIGRRRRGIDFWPGFVDALAALLMVMIFVILIFTIGQFVLTDAVSGRDRALAQLNAELSQLAEQLSLETNARKRADVQLGELSASLASSESARQALDVRLQSTEAARAETEAARAAAEAEGLRLVADIAALQRLKTELEAEAARLASQLDSTGTALKEKTELSERSIAQVELLNRQLAALRTQLEQLNEALGAAETAARSKDLEIEELGKKLNVALASRVQKLARYRSEFFGRLREVLDKRDDVQIVGDRFVFSSEVLFDSASDNVSEAGKHQLAKLASTLKGIAREIPADLPWVLQVDGHTDRRPISTERFPSNWELSTARALSIVKFLRAQGIEPQRLAATGYGEFHPLDERNTDAAYAKNRRIELKLTNR